MIDPRTFRCYLQLMGESVYRFPSNQRQFEETIVFIPWFRAQVEALSGHIEMVNEMGFDSEVVRLTQVGSYFQIKELQKIRGGLVSLWAKEIQRVLGQRSSKKIVYSFSVPSFGAIRAVAENVLERTDQSVCGIICDGGPFVNLGWKAFWRYFTYQEPVKSRILRAWLSIFGPIALGINFERELVNHLRQLPEGFPLLSIRGWQDQLVPSSQIEAAFDKQDHLDLYTLALPEGQHLNGLRDFGDVYKPKVSEFLHRVATSLK